MHLSVPEFFGTPMYMKASVPVCAVDGYICMCMLSSYMALSDITSDEDDLLAFQSTLPPQYCASASGSVPSSTSASSHPSPTAASPVASDFPVNSLQDPRGHSRASLSYLLSSHYFSLALAVSGVCRAVHAVLTGPRARRRTEAGVAIRENSIVEIWDGLEQCWEDFESLRRGAGGIGTVGGGLIRGEDVERFVSGWQVFIFECLNVIREALKHRMNSQTKGSPDPNGSHSADRGLCRLYAQATRRCRVVLPRVIAILKRHLAVPSSGFFAHDVGLIGDGCFFAALLLAQGDLDQEDCDLKGEDGLPWDADIEDGVDACLRALGEIGWIFSNSNDREKTVRMVWEARVIRDDERRRERNRQRDYLEDQRAQAYHSGQRSQDRSPYMIDKPALPNSGRGQGPSARSLSLVSAAGQCRPLLPPLSLAFSQVESAPNTALTDGSSSWHTYTPPTTSGSMTSNATTNRSASPADSSSPQTLSSMKHLPAMQSLKNENDAFYNGFADLDPFSFSVDSTSGPGVIGPGVGMHAWSPRYQHQVSPGSSFLDASVIFTGAECPSFYQ